MTLMDITKGDIWETKKTGENKNGMDKSRT